MRRILSWLTAAFLLLMCIAIAWLYSFTSAPPVSHVAASGGGNFPGSF